MRIPVSIRTRYFMADKRALVDSGATDNFINLAFAKRMGLGLQELPKPRKIFNIDNTTNKAGSITHFLDLSVKTKGITKEMRFLVTDIGSEDILLGYPWLATFEPRFNWQSATIDERTLPVVISSINPTIEHTVIATTITEASKERIVKQLQGQSRIGGIATELAIQAGEGKKKKQKYQRNTNDSASSSAKKNRRGSHQHDPGITPSNSKKEHQMPLTAKSTQ